MGLNIIVSDFFSICVYFVFVSEKVVLVKVIGCLFGVIIVFNLVLDILFCSVNFFVDLKYFKIGVFVISSFSL